MSTQLAYGGVALFFHHDNQGRPGLGVLGMNLGLDEISEEGFAISFLLGFEYESEYGIVVCDRDVGFVTAADL